MQDRRIIYDVGANNGDDVPYYLRKADLVVAVEANPLLAAHVRERFAAEIAAGRVVVEACVVTADDGPATVPFYIHAAEHPRSRFPRPDDMTGFEEIMLPARPIRELVAQHGPPYYIKLDIEGYDEAILRALFAAGIRPPFISAEAHRFEIFAILVAIGGYGAFKLVDGRTVDKRFASHPIAGPNGTELLSFPAHSAGPFGDDVPGPWRSADHFSRILTAEEFGWKDIHASLVRKPDPGAAMNLRKLGLSALRKWARRRIGTLVPLPPSHPIKQYLDV